MSRRAVNLVVCIVVAVLSLAILANSMTKPLGRDEQMYCTAGALMARGQLVYRDFSYPAQMPYHPLLYAGLFKALDTTRYLLVGRVTSVAADILAVICIVGIYRRLFRYFPVSGGIFGLAAAVLYVFNPSVDYSNGYAWNHDIVFMLVLVSFWLLISVDYESKSRYWRISLVGILLTLATWMRVTTAVVELVFFLGVLIRSGGSIQKRCKTALPFVVGAAIVSIWPVWVIAQAPEAFILNIFRIPVLYGRWLHEIGMVHDKGRLIIASLTTPGYAMLVVTGICLFLAVLCRRGRLSRFDKAGVGFAALLPVVFFVIALIPPTMWRQYMAMPVPFLIISFAYSLLYLRKAAEKREVGGGFKMAWILIAASVFVSVVSYPVVLQRIPALLNPKEWAANRLHETAGDIAENTSGRKLILTLAPLYAIEGGCDIYTELSAGSIIYRIADSLSATERDVTHTVGPETLAGMLARAEPSAVVLNVEFDFLEKPLFEQAVGADWEKKVYPDHSTAYFRH